MSSARWLSPLGCIAFVGTAALLAAGIANAAPAASPSDSHAAAASAGESSSTDYLALVNAPDAAEPAASSAAGGQYDNSGGGGGTGSGLRSRLAFEVSGGFNGPTSNTSNFLTWGGQFTVGGGLRFRHGLSVLVDYQFMDDKLPGKLIAETGATGGNAHIWSFTINPEYDFFPKRATSVYATGGGGFYRKVTSFTDPTQTYYCDYFYGCYPGVANQVVGHFSSNQGGWNFGGGYQHRIGGMYDTGRMKLFVEARFVDVLTPAVTTQPNGLGTTTVAADTKVIPVTLGLRW